MAIVSNSDIYSSIWNWQGGIQVPCITIDLYVDMFTWNPEDDIIRLVTEKPLTFNVYSVETAMQNNGWTVGKKFQFQYNNVPETADYIGAYMEISSDFDIAWSSMPQSSVYVEQRDGTSRRELGAFYGYRTDDNYGGFNIPVISRFFYENDFNKSPDYSIVYFFKCPVASLYSGDALINTTSGMSVLAIFGDETSIYSEALGNVLTQHYGFQIHKEYDDDPNSGGGNSETGGGGGDFDNTSDPVDIPGLPTLTAVDAGFITLFNPTLEQLKSLSQYMWTSDFATNIKKLFADPMNAILGLNIVPVSIPSSTIREVKVGFIGTGVSMSVADSQYIEVNCGSINVKEYWGSALDYSPFTKCYIYLPYIGAKALNIDDIMTKTLQVVYHIDILDGACVAFIKAGNAVMYQYVGQCAQTIPVTGQNFAQIVSSAINIAGMVGATVATGGMGAPITAAMGVSMGVNLAQNVTNAKPSIEHSGSYSGSGAQLGNQIPYLILERPRQSLAKNYKGFVGYPSNIRAKLGNIEGFTMVEEIHLDNISCTEKEKNEIYELLKKGVIL